MEAKKTTYEELRDHAKTLLELVKYMDTQRPMHSPRTFQQALDAQVAASSEALANCGDPGERPTKEPLLAICREGRLTDLVGNADDVGRPWRLLELNPHTPTHVMGDGFGVYLQEGAIVMQSLVDQSTLRKVDKGGAKA